MNFTDGKVSNIVGGEQSIKMKGDDDIDLQFSKINGL